MTLGTAALLLAVAVADTVLTGKYLRERWVLRIIRIVLLSLITVALTCYVRLTTTFIDAARDQPPMP